MNLEALKEFRKSLDEDIATLERKRNIKAEEDTIYNSTRSLDYSLMIWLTPRLQLLLEKKIARNPRPKKYIKEMKELLYFTENYDTNDEKKVYNRGLSLLKKYLPSMWL